MTETTRLAPGDPAPDFELTTDTGETLRLADLRRQAGGPLRLSGRDDPRLHHPGVRLPRLAAVAARPPASR